MGTACITPKAPGATFVRPERLDCRPRALSRAIDGTGWSAPRPPAVEQAHRPGLVQFARSSGGPATGTTCDPNEVGRRCLTYIPFGRDAMSFAYYARGTRRRPGDDHLTAAQLTHDLLDARAAPHRRRRTSSAARSRPSSGTYQFWRDKLGLTDTQINDATQVCTPAHRTTPGERRQRPEGPGRQHAGTGQRPGRHRLLGRRTSSPRPTASARTSSRPRTARSSSARSMPSACPTPAVGTGPLSPERRRSTPTPPSAGTSTTSCPRPWPPGPATTT